MIRKLFFALAFIIIGANSSFAAFCNPSNNIYNYLVPACIVQDESYIATGTGSDVCVTTAKVCSGTQFTNAQIAAITTAGMVSGASLYSLSSTPSGAGAFPIANGGTGQTTRDPALSALLPSQTGNFGKDLVTNGTSAGWGYPSGLTVTSQTWGDLLFYNGTIWTRFGAGTAGQTLVSGGTGANPLWGSPYSSTNQYYSPKYTTTTTVDWNNGNVQYVALTNGGQTFTFANPKDGGRYILILKQPASGAAGTVTLPASVLWSGGTAPILTATNGKVDLISLIYDGTNSKYYGGEIPNF